MAVVEPSRNQQLLAKKNLRSLKQLALRALLRELALYFEKLAVLAKKWRLSYRLALVAESGLLLRRVAVVEPSRNHQLLAKKNLQSLKQLSLRALLRGLALYFEKLAVLAKNWRLSYRLALSTRYFED